MSLISTFEEFFHTSPQRLAQAPGRVNLLGEHVDYNNGVVLPAAIDRAVRMAISPTLDRVVTLCALDLKEKVSFRLDEVDARVDIDGKPLPGWATYPAGVAWVLMHEGKELTGLQAVYTSDVPIGAGLSSSAAVEVAFAVAWRDLSGWEADAMTLARYCQRAENKYVGVNCGLMDQFASACGVEKHALYFDTRSLDWHPLPLPPGTAIVIADSGVRRSLSTSAYNERRAACEEAVKLLQKYLPNIHSLRDISSVEFAAYSEYLPPITRQRAEHVVKEMARVDQAVICLDGQDALLFGGLMYAGHASLRDLYEVSCPELDILVNATRKLPGCYGARLTGAGFGGCTVNLVDETHAEAFIQGLRAEYQDQTGREAAIYLCQASAGAASIPV
jgi:galactokinase